MPKGALSSYFYSHVQGLLETCEAKVATLPAKHDEANGNALLGFSIVEKPSTVHMVYVSKNYWRCGVAKALLFGLDKSGMVVRIWPNCMAGSDTEWIRDRLDGVTYLPHWMENTHGTGNKRADSAP